jgi:superfamily II RNA helicase
LFSDLSSCQTVTAWADGCTWNEALQISGLPPGDLVRVLSRALDTLRQIGNLPYMPVRGDEMNTASIQGIHPDIRQLCRKAAKAINRYPLKDPYSLQTNDDEEQGEYASDSMESDENEDDPI